MTQYEALKISIHEAYKRHASDRPFIVALDGLSGSGKTTLARLLKDELENVLLIHIDDHITERKRRYHTGRAEWFEYYQLQWDTAELKEQLFEKLRSGEKELSLLFYDKEKDCSSVKALSVMPGAIVLVEGVFLLREEWKAFYDYAIFLDCPRAVRNERVLKRDAYIGDLTERLKKYQNRYWKAEDYYLEKQKPLQSAHEIFHTSLF